MRAPAPGIESIAELCSDQLPIYSNIGRGPSGTSYKVEIEGGDTPVLVGSVYDPDKDEWSEEWRTPSIGGGRLSYKVNEDTPLDGLFTITFTYTQPGLPESDWEFTTPALQIADDFNYANWADINTVLGFDGQEILVNPEELNVKKYVDDKDSKLDTDLRQYVLEQKEDLKTALSAEIDADVEAAKNEVTALIPILVPMTDEEVRSIFSKEVSE